jgi:transposase
MPMPSRSPLLLEDPTVNTPPINNNGRPSSVPGGEPPSASSAIPTGKTVGSHEVRPRTPRRTFTLAEKRRIVAEADQCTQRGEIGALLRREGIYSSNLSNWRRILAKGGSEPRRGRPTKVGTKDRAIADLERKVARLQRGAERANALLSLQKKAFQLLEAAEAIGTS